MTDDIWGVPLAGERVDKDDDAAVPDSPDSPKSDPVEETDPEAETQSGTEPTEEV